jgi:hypothetical protein
MFRYSFAFNGLLAPVGFSTDAISVCLNAEILRFAQDDDLVWNDAQLGNSAQVEGGWVTIRTQGFL